MNIPINNQSTVPSGQLYPIINVDDRINNNRIILSLRNEIIQWLYRAQKYLHFSRSTLHLTVGVLDKIIVNNFKINKDNIELVSGSLLLICSKLNQKSYLSARRINSMLRKDNDHCSRDYIQTQALICQTLNYNILPENIIYQKLSELQVRCAKEKVHKCKQFVKIALMNVRSETESDAIVLLQAIEGLVSAGLFQNERRSDESNTQVQRIQTQLKRLHFMAHQ